MTEPYIVNLSEIEYVFDAFQVVLHKKTGGGFSQKMDGIYSLTKHHQEPEVFNLYYEAGQRTLFYLSKIRGLLKPSKIFRPKLT